MKSLYAFLALACVGALPACTVNRYYAPGYGPGGVREYHTTDTVYVNTGGTTIINQSGTVGGPQGGYANNGPGRTTPPPPPPRANGPVGTYPPPRTTPPPRNTGGVRTPPPTRQPTAGTPPPPTTYPPTGGQPGTGPVRNPGNPITPPPAGNGNPVTPTPGTLGGGVRNNPGGSASGGTSTTPAGSSGTNNGSGMSNNPGGTAGTPITTPGGPGSSGSTPNGTLGGGVRTNTGGTTTVGGGNTAGGGIRTGGIKPSRNNQPTTTNEDLAPAEYPTGGIKPIPTTPGPPTASTPGNLEPAPTSTGQNSGGIRTGGIKPSRNNQPTTNEDLAPAEYPTGGIKPIPTTTTTTPAPVAENPTGGIRTGGIKPSRGSDTGGGRVLTSSDMPGTLAPMPGSGAPADAPQTLGEVAPGKAAAPALMFSKMPCRGTCPSYTATIWPDGRVMYVGQQNVAHIGTYELHLEPAAVAAMQQQARQANFDGLAASYTNGATDIPATVLTMYGTGGSFKTVTVEDGAPAEVQALFDYVNGTINQLVAGSQFPEERPTQRRGR